MSALSLSFDGCGINLPDEYRSRLCTFQYASKRRETTIYGPMFAAAPEMLEALKAAQLELEANKVAMHGPEWAAQRTATGGALLAVSRAIFKAEAVL